MTQSDKSLIVVPGGPETPRITPAGTVTDPDNPEVIARDIEQTRAQMSQTLAAIECKLNPTELREKAVEELHVVEVKVKEAVREQIDQTKEQVKEAVREQIDETKAKVKGELIEAKDTIKHEIQEAIHHAKQSLHDATIGKVEHMVRRANETVEETSESIIETIRANPVPAALAGIGLAWLFMNRRSASTRMRSERNLRVSSDVSGYGLYDRDYERFGDRYADSQGYREFRSSGVDEPRPGIQERAGRAIDRAQERVADMAHNARDAAGNTIHQVRDAAGNVVNQVRDTAGNVVNQVRDTAGNLAHQVSDTAGNVAHRASDLAHRASEQASHLAVEARQGVIRAEQRAEETYYQNPLAMGAVAMAVGAAVGLSLPRTRREDELLGGARDQLLQKAQRAVHDALDTAHQYTDRAVDQARSTIEAAPKTF